MKNKASVAHDFMKVSRDLEEALARGPFTACELRVIAWVKARTYGVRVRDGEKWAALDAIAVSSSFVSSDTGLNRGRVKEAIESLLADGILRRKANGWLGINSRLSDWKRARQGREFDFDQKPRTDIGRRAWDKASLGQGVTGSGGQGVTGHPGQGVTGDLGQGVPGAPGALKERVRVETVESRDGESPKLLPNEKNDTPRNRAELGHGDFAPEGHPEFKRLSFKLQDELNEIWKTAREKARAANACKKCRQYPKAKESWPYCVGCTTCVECSEGVNGKRTFTVSKGEIICTVCKEKK